MTAASIASNKKYFPLLLLLLVFAVAAGSFIHQAGQYLVLNEEPVKTDVILVFAGDKGQRTEKAIDLYLQGYSNRIVLSGGPMYMQVTSAKLMYDHAIGRGVRAEDLILEEQSDSTFENAVLCRQIMEERNYQSAIVVSSEYHMRRVRLSCEAAFKGSSIRLVYCAADDPAYDPERWWANNKSLIWTANEYIKLIGYELGLAS